MRERRPCPYTKCRRHRHGLCRLRRHLLGDVNRATAYIMFVAVSLGCTIALVSAASTASTAKDLAARNARQQSAINQIVGELAMSSRAQVQNRASNVNQWCDGINQSRDYARRYLRQIARTPPYQLPDLDCKALVAGTLQSAAALPRVGATGPTTP